MLSIISILLKLKFENIIALFLGSLAAALSVEEMSNKVGDGLETPTHGTTKAFDELGLSLKEVQKMEHKNLAVELLEKLLKDEVKSRFRTNVVMNKKFSELLQNALTRYQNRSIEAAQVIAELIEMANEFKKNIEKTNELNLNPAENAFYDALSNNKSAEELMGEEVLMQIAREIAEKLRKNIVN